MSDFPHGMRAMGGLASPRLRVDHRSAFAAYCQCLPRARVHEEGYLSAFRFGDEFAEQLATFGTPKGFAGDATADHVCFDFDAAALEEALRQVRLLVQALEATYWVPPEWLLVFFSGSKGFHVHLPACLWNHVPSSLFPRVCRALAEQVATVAGVIIDQSVYSTVQMLRAPNSRHPKTGLHKVPIAASRLDAMSTDDIRTMARSPIPLDVPLIESRHIAALQEAWDTSLAEVESATRRPPAILPLASVNTLTKRIIRGLGGLEQGDRHRHLYSAAANLAECGVPLHAIRDLLLEAGTESGLPPHEVIRQIEWGHSRGLESRCT